MTDEKKPDQQAVAALAVMLEAFPASTITASMNGTYLEAIQGISTSVVEETCADFRHGRVERNNHAFVPSTAEFARRIRRNHSEWCRMYRPKPPEIEAQRPKLSDEKRAEIIKRFKELSESLRSPDRMGAGHHG